MRPRIYIRCNDACENLRVSLRKLMCVAGNFCQQHVNEIFVQRQQMAFFEEVEDLFDRDRKKLEKAQVQLAKALSPEDDTEKKVYG